MHIHLWRKLQKLFKRNEGHQLTLRPDHWAVIHRLNLLSVDACDLRHVGGWEYKVMLLDSNQNTRRWPMSG